MPPRDLRAYLFDIAEACTHVEDFTRGVTFDQYQHSLILRSAVGPG